MELKLSMWNFHSWLQNREIEHSFSIRSNAPAICGVRLRRDTADEGCAVLSDAPQSSGFRTVLTFEENYIYFRTLLPFPALDELNYMLSVYSHWEQALRRINLTYGKVTELLALSYELLPHPIVVFQGDRLLAVSPRFREGSETLWEHYRSQTLDKILRELPDGVAEDRLSEQTDPVLLPSSLLHGKQIILCSRHFQHQQFRLIVSANGTPLSPGDLHLIHVLTESVRCNLELWNRRIHQQSIGPEALFLSILQDSAVPPHAAAALRQLDWEEQQHYTVFWLEKRDGSDSLVLDKLHQFMKNRYPGAFSLQYRCAVVAFCNLDAGVEIPCEESLRQSLPSERFLVGQSSSGAGFSLLPQLAKQAEKTLRRARQGGRFFLAAQQVMLEYIHQALLDDVMLQSLVHPAVRQLQRCDRSSGSHFTEILWQYLRLGGNCNAASKALHMHRNTLSHHLLRIQELTEISLDDPQEREALLLSLLISRTPKAGNDGQGT